MLFTLEFMAITNEDRHGLGWLGDDEALTVLNECNGNRPQSLMDLIWSLPW